MRVRSRDDLARALIDRFRRDEPLPGVHVSDLANPCLRRVYYTKRGMVETRDEDLLMWLAGMGHHSLMEGKLREIELEDDGITGTIDCLERGDAGEMTVVEFKTTRASADKDVVTSYNWWSQQIMGYCHLFGSNIARLYVLHLMGSWSPPTEPALKVYELEFTENEVAGNWGRLLARRDVLLASLRQEKPPVGPNEGCRWACNRCAAKEVCHG